MSSSLKPRRKVALVTKLTSAGGRAVADFARISAQAQTAMLPDPGAVDRLNVTAGGAASMSAIDGVTQFGRQVAMHGDCYLNNPNNASACLKAAQSLTSDFGAADLPEGVGYIQGGYSMRPVPSYMKY
jgi:hypothetical protein